MKKKFKIFYVDHKGRIKQDKEWGAFETEQAATEHLPYYSQFTYMVLPVYIAD